MKKQDLQKVGSGFYVDSNKSVYLDVNEFMAAYNIPDRPEVRQEWYQLREMS